VYIIGTLILNGFDSMDHVKVCMKRQDSILEAIAKTELINGAGRPKRTAQKIMGDVIPIFRGEFWTSRQRQANSIHEVPYRACFKAQLPAFFINKFTKPDDTVYDPFSGRGTTGVEAGLLSRKVILNDSNPLMEILSRARFFIPSLMELQGRLDDIGRTSRNSPGIDLSMFYHPKTLEELMALRDYLISRREAGKEDDVDRWIRMVATTRLTGHSSGFFSVYTLPPNQAVTPERQIRLNQKREQKPDYRDIHKILIKKTRSLTRDITPKIVDSLSKAGRSARFLSCDSTDTPDISDNSVSLTVTSPPFLNVVDYPTDNWLRCWFNNIDLAIIQRRITVIRDMEEWCGFMQDTFNELYRITKPGGCVAFEVGEVKGGRVKLEEHIVPIGIDAGFIASCIVINAQEFTKTSNIWGVDNMKRGTNTNRIVIFVK